MDLTPNTYAADCPTRQILDRIADKWTVLILQLLEREPRRFNALRREIQGLSQKVLSQTLKTLERDGFVTRTAFPTVPVTVEYALTPLGRSLAITLSPLSRWAEAHMQAVESARAAFDVRSGSVVGAATPLTGMPSGGARALV
ncbi:transcriptional regulator [Azorhizobium oxalatiphilum]|uniref:Transcriptional regulator n=1 Tax=Azorhizobium oxalatiphilum TaxID=980631 RepID=A0A917FKB6_9HYPH|nr:helix-turn-helix domain-containing protein [Azorhizobium oxalatiphilum]GGF87777.1 transcriptional regulator [Azorhizobium oxalatiphilum]